MNSQAYHEIKTYNTIRDGIWQIYATLLEAQDDLTILTNSIQLSALLLRADSIWHEVEESAKTHAKSLKLRNQTFEYKSEMFGFSERIDKYVGFMQRSKELTEELYDKDKEFTEYSNMQSHEKKRRFIKAMMKEIVKETDITWGRLASSIGFGMPLKLSEASDVFFRVATALQTPYDEEDYQRYLKWTGEKRYKKLAYCLALYKVKRDAHIQAVVAGEFSQGKSTTAMKLGKWDQIFTRRLLKIYRPTEYNKEKMRFELDTSVIISPKDPASKYLKNPEPWRVYVIDEGYLFATSSTAATRATKRIRDNIAQNRKQHPSNYWIYPNIFKMPSLLLEMMDVYIQKENVAVGDIIIPYRVMQMKEKFNKEKLEKYARYPKFFTKLIRHHSGFIAKVRFPKIKTTSPFWQRYLAKYEKYKITDEGEDAKAKTKEVFFVQVNKLIDKGVVTVETKADVSRLMFQLVKKKTKQSDASARIMSNTLADEYMNWKEESITNELTSEISNSILSDIKPELEMKDEGGDDGT